jgi:adenosine deaminase
VEARLLLCTLRHLAAEQSMRTAELVRQFQGSLVAGLDIAGDEAGFPLEPHVPAFRYAAEHGLARTAHAGESMGPASVWETLRALEPSRIGHGVRSVEDPALVAHLRRQGVHLEVCPSSNVLTSVVARYRDHPVDRLYRAGVPLGISTDVRTMTGVTLTAEYELLRDTFGWRREDLHRCNQDALAAAFAPPQVKRRVAERLGTEAGAGAGA